ncbi:MAG: UDP-N-acetylmuramoyl-tripeptide--D-alanyl-D-alanine ligase [Alphaproteobacteria bacterium]|nr:UDP-N-acetylmuramoyl-tripeptide--D-alanyl-D-alanine ligase [Alphaproteobacteria bacterium]
MSAALWTAAEARAATRGTLAGPAGWAATGISIDTRTLVPGDLFVALKGEVADGHTFLPAAFEKGAAAALVAEPAAGKPCLVVSDTLAGVADLGRAARSRADVRALAVTGSVGKTSTKEAIAHALGEQGATHAARASFNNHIGVPVTLARMPRDTVYGVFEVGMNHAGEIVPLVGMIRPEVALVTTVEAVHTENFADGIAGVAAAKAEVFSAGGPFAHGNPGTAVLPADNDFCDFLASRAKEAGWGRIVRFGTKAGADVRLVDWSGDATKGRAKVDLAGRILDFEIGAPGAHWALNLTGALAAIDALGADAARAAASFARVSAPKGRGQHHQVALAGGTFLLIDDSYNASPPSMRAAFAVLAAAPATRRVAVLGDMLELGPKAGELHEDLARSLEANRIDRVYCCGPNMRRLYEKLPAAMRGAHAANSADLEPAVLRAVNAGDAVVVKGSLGSRMGRVVEALLGLGAANENGRRAAGGRQD